MNTTFKCKYCQKDNEISEAITAQIQDEIMSQERLKHKAEIDDVKRQTEIRAGEKAKADYELIVNDLKESTKEEKERNNKLLVELTELNKKFRELERKDEERKLEMEKRITETEVQARENAKKQADEEKNIVIQDKEKKLQDAMKQIEDLRRKMQQGSQQTQGEILELEVEKILKENFKFDQILEVKKGTKGADIKHMVCSNHGSECGLILWETKNYQEKWSGTWIPKLKQDVREAGAVLGVLVTHTFPSTITTDISFVDGVWVCKPGLTIPLAIALRDRIYEVAKQKAVGSDRSKKADILYDYISGNNFRQQIEAMIEVYQEMNNQIETERRVFETQWKARSKQLDKYLMGAASICGSIQGIAGQASIPSFKGLDILAIETGTKISL